MNPNGFSIGIVDSHPQLPRVQLSMILTQRKTLKVCLHVTDFSPFYGKRAVLGCSHLTFLLQYFGPSFLCLHVLNKAPFTPRGIVFIDLVSHVSI